MGETAHSAKSKDVSSPTAMSAMSELQKVGFGPMAWMGTAWFEAMGELGTEVTQFVADRIKEDVKAQHRILHCKDVSELREIQLKFMQTAIDQYTAETGKIVKLSNDMLSAAMAQRSS